MDRHGIRAKRLESCPIQAREIVEQDAKPYALSAQAFLS
jgi:hypothetical protein